MRLPRSLRRIIPAGILIVALLSLSLRPTNVKRVDAASPDYRTDQVVVRINPLSGATIADINSTHGTSMVASLEDGSRIYLLKPPAGQSPLASSEDLAADPRLEFAEPNFIGQAPEATPRNIKGFGGFEPALFFQQYARELLELAQAHRFSTGKGTLVAVLDTGAQLNHPALGGSIVAGYDFVANDAVPADEFSNLDTDNNGVADEAAGHGTHVAGIIHMIAPDARIMPLRVLDSDGFGDLFTIAKAIDYASSHGARVISLSLGTPEHSDLLDDVIRSATLGGATVVAAAGNLSSSVEQYPAASQCALAVTATGATDLKSNFANFGGWINFAAPGENIYSAYPNGGHAVASGTSMATPFVAGQAALLYSLAPSLNARSVGMLIGGTAHSLDALNPAVAGKLGDGRIDIGASVAALVSGAIPTSGHGRISNSCVVP